MVIWSINLSLVQQKMIDSHTHLNSDKLFENREQHLKDFEDEWWDRLVNAWASREYNENGIRISREYKWESFVKCSLWLHPDDAIDGIITDENLNGNIQKIENMYSENKEYVVAIWECWIDIHCECNPNIELQKKLFDAQCKLARKLWLPIMIHSRDDFDTTFEILENYKDLKIYVHCRWYWPKQIAKLQNNFQNLWVWFCGNTTYNSAENLRESLKLLDIDKLLIETDAPYLPTKKFRWQINTPAMITHLYDFISEFLWIERIELEKKVEKNFDRLYIN